jgi:hypothetical protein
MQRFKILLI